MGLPTILFVVACYFMLPEVIGRNAPYVLVAASGFATAVALVVLIWLDAYTNIMDGKQGPPDSFKGLDSGTISKIWPRVYWGSIIMAQVVGAACLFFRSGYFTYAGRVRGTIFYLLAVRGPIFLLSLMIAFIVAKKDMNNLGDVLLRLFKAFLNFSGVTLLIVIIGTGLVQLPKRLWLGTADAQEDIYKTRILKAQSESTYRIKIWRSVAKGAEEKRNAVPLSEPVYALYEAAIKNPIEPFEPPFRTPAELQALQDAGEDEEDEETVEERKMRKRELLSGAIRGHWGLANMRESLWDSQSALWDAERNVALSEEALDAFLDAGGNNTTCTIFGFVSTTASLATAAVSAYLVWWFFMSIIVYTQGLSKSLSGVAYLVEVYGDKKLGPTLLYSIMVIYFFAAAHYGLFYWRYYFGLHHFGFSDNENRPAKTQFAVGSVLRWSEALIYLIHPAGHIFSLVYNSWGGSGGLACDSFYSDISVYGTFGKDWTRWSGLFIGLLAIVTFLFRVPQTVEKMWRAHVVAKLSEEDAERRKAGVRGLKPAKSIFDTDGTLSDFAIFGVPEEGQLLWVGGELPSQFEDRYLTYQWLQRETMDPDDDWMEIDNADTAEYTPTAEDVGFYLQCTCTATTPDGEEMPPMVAQTTERIRVAFPRMIGMKVVGGPYHTAAYTIQGRYVGGIEGESVIQWYKIKKGQIEPIVGARDFAYQPGVDDVACTLRVEYTPVREDGIKGVTVQADSTPLKIDPTVAKAIKANIVASNAEFNVRFIDRGQEVAQQIVVNNKQLRIRERKNVKVKADLGPGVSIILEAQAQTFKILIDGKPPLTFRAADAKQRDIIALTLRSFVVLAQGKQEKAAQQK